MPTEAFPSRPDLDQLRRRAKDLAKAARQGEPAALARVPPSLAVMPDKRLGWPPLLFACNSRWHQIEPRRSAGIVEVARLLLDAGASPDTAVGRAPRPAHCSALYAAAGLANHAALAQLLLDHGAEPDTPSALYHSAFHRDHETLGLLLERGARAEGPDALAAAISVNDTGAVRLLLAAGIDPREPLPAAALGASYEGRPPIPPVYAAIEFDCGLDLIQALLDGGADPTAAPVGGRSPYREARRRGRAELAVILIAHGAVDDTGA
jgi:ankyrin repeat protein